MNIYNCSILPTEHLISLVVRSHILSGNKKLTSTATQLNFDVVTSLKAQQFNNSTLLNMPSSCSDLQCENKLILTHTPAALWALTTPHEKQGTWDPTVVYKREELNQRRLLEFKRSWHFCPECVLMDKNKNGFSYWHVGHQLPGVSHCYLHDVRLRTCSVALRDLRDVSIPEVHLSINEVTVKQESDFVKWSQFVFLMFKTLQSNPNKATEWKNKAQQYLNLPTKSTYLNKPLFDARLKELENEVESELLSFLFKFYKKTPENMINILRITLTDSGSSSYRNPIYWLVILFWLRDKIGIEV
tara:strand:- start:3058 stop:3960 length:903 start_codon:yes stop_codon:yes gene_type:complete